MTNNLHCVPWVGLRLALGWPWVGLELTLGRPWIGVWVPGLVPGLVTGLVFFSTYTVLYLSELIIQSIHV